MKSSFFIVLSVFLVFSLKAQNFQKVVISYQKVGDGLYDMYAENPNFYPLQISLNFTELDNYSASEKLPYVATLYSGKKKIMNLRRTILDIPGSFKQTNITRVGAYPVKYDPTTFYKLPIAIGKQTKAFSLDVSKSDDPTKIMWCFSLSEGDTVYSCREGVVCMVTESKNNNGYRAGENEITVLHPDYSFGKYEVFADSSLFVKLGDTIKAGSALGLAGGGSYAIGAHLRYSVYYCNARIDSINDLKLRNFNKYINPVFETGKAKKEVLKNDMTYVQE